MKIDLGCGTIKHPGCHGIDKLPYDGVDLVHDFDSPLPFEAGTVDFVMASNSLQYAADADFVLREIYRVCRHRAVVCIVVPYAHVSAHIANRRYRQLLNEHAPRYWTRHPVCYVDPDEYKLSGSRNWSLMEEAVILPIEEEDAEQQIAEGESEELDLRLLKLEFFYFPPYDGLYEPHELSLLRQSQMNVAYQMMLHLVVVKERISDEEISIMAAQPLEEPVYVDSQRFRPQEEKSGEPFLYTGPMDLLLDGMRAGEAGSASASIPEEAASPAAQQSPPSNRRHDSSRRKKRAARSPKKTPPARNKPNRSKRAGKRKPSK
ncbi:methyltransferase domain-containing protein [Paenibacillus sp. P22]|uniref:class I SAM-dependent methyltransferase n=1 Tax=Paenibacillus sp. P22 TaxID=483908 RepID=UPI00039018B2|nr:methyltransferase domain-containing protein [Paenibacillus sp. P22]CDN43787.1 Methyltransferase domain protein [Paenibacillus sp. P22]